MSRSLVLRKNSYYYHYVYLSSFVVKKRVNYGLVNIFSIRLSHRTCWLCWLHGYSQKYFRPHV